MPKISPPLTFTTPISVIPAPMPPALAVSTAVAAAYMLHLLEFKLLYLGGIPTPAGPVPMIGIVPVVF